jgi:transposase-like protein
VSRHFTRASSRALRQLVEGRHDDREWLVLLLDGKTFADDQMVNALGVTTTGEKRLLGLVQTATKNKKTCAAFLRELEYRGFAAPNGLLVVLDASKGLRAAARDVFGDDIPVPRCEWHKREKIVSDLAKAEQVVWRRKLQAAYAQSSYADAKRARHRLVREMEVRNVSAARSLEEGLYETLTLYRLNVHRKLGISATNLIESVMARVEAITRRVDRCRTSDQKLRWRTASLLHIQRGFRAIDGCKKLGLLQRALQHRTLTPRAAA